jgi:hypothetical protein
LNFVDARSSRHQPDDDSLISVPVRLYYLLSSVPTLTRIVKMASVHSMLGFSRVHTLRVFAFLAAVGVLFLSTSPVQGQEIGSSQTPSEGPTHSSQLPDWAEPVSPSSGIEGSGDGFAQGPEAGASKMEDQMRTKAAPGPGDGGGGDPVPVDGGVFLLAAAGAGYAVRKLKKEDEDDDGEPG